MLFKQAILARIETGEITAAFRKWRRPSVKQGGTQKTSAGLLSIDSVDPIEDDQITEAQALAAGYASAKDVLEDPANRREGSLYFIRFSSIGLDPRISLRENASLTAEEWKDVTSRLARLDKASKTGPWTEKALTAIETKEGVRAGDLAPGLGQEREAFKLNVRKLKDLRLTESLDTGCRLSPRGIAVLKELRERSSC